MILEAVKRNNIYHTSNLLSSLKTLLSHLMIRQTPLKSSSLKILIMFQRLYLCSLSKPPLGKWKAAYSLKPKIQCNHNKSKNHSGSNHLSRMLQHRITLRAAGPLSWISRVAGHLLSVWVVAAAWKVVVPLFKTCRRSDEPLTTLSLRAFTKRVPISLISLERTWWLEKLLKHQAECKRSQVFRI